MNDLDYVLSEVQRLWQEGKTLKVYEILSQYPDKTFQIQGRIHGSYLTGEEVQPLIDVNAHRLRKVMQHYNDGNITQAFECAKEYWGDGQFLEMADGRSISVDQAKLIDENGNVSYKDAGGFLDIDGSSFSKRSGLKLHLPVFEGDINRMDSIMKQMKAVNPNFMYKYAPNGLGENQFGKNLTIYVAEGLDTPRALEEFTGELQERMHQNGIRTYSPDDLPQNANLLNDNLEWKVKGAEGEIYYSYDGYPGADYNGYLKYDKNQVGSYQAAADGDRRHLKAQNDPFEQVDLNNYKIRKMMQNASSYQRQDQVAAYQPERQLSESGNIALHKGEEKVLLSHPEGQPEIFIGEKKVRVDIKNILRENKDFIDQGGVVLIGRDPQVGEDFDTNYSYRCVTAGVSDETVSRTQGYIYKRSDGGIYYVDYSRHGSMAKLPRSVNPKRIGEFVRMNSAALGSSIVGTAATAYVGDQILGDGNSTSEGTVLPITPVGTLQASQKAAQATTQTVKTALKTARTAAKSAAKMGSATTLLMAAIDPEGTREFIDDVAHLRLKKLGTESLQAAQMLMNNPGAVAGVIGDSVASTVSKHYEGTQGVGDATVRTGAALGQGVLNIGDTFWGGVASAADVTADGSNWVRRKLGMDEIAKDTITYDAYKKDPLKFVGNLIVPTTVDTKTGLRSDDDLYSIVDRGDAKALEAYIKEGKEDVNRPFNGTHNEDIVPYESALVMAADKGKMAVAKVLYEQKGANLNAVNTATGDTTLMTLMKGIAPTPYDAEYKTGVPDTASCTDKEKNNTMLGQAMIDDMLTNKKVDLEAVNKEGKNAFLVAAECGNLSAVKQIADKGGDVNKVSANGSNALHISCHNQQMTLALLEMGVNPNQANKKGETPLMRALTNSGGNANSISLLMMYTNEEGIEYLKKSPRHLEKLDKLLKDNPKAKEILMSLEGHPMQAFVQERYQEQKEALAQTKTPQEKTQQEKQTTQSEGNKSAAEQTVASTQANVVLQSAGQNITTPVQEIQTSHTAQQGRA